MTETLVIGGTGAMGGRVVQRLVDASNTLVSVLTRDPHSRQAAQLISDGGGRVRMIKGDITDVASVVTAQLG